MPVDMTGNIKWIAYGIAAWMLWSVVKQAK